MFSPTIPGTPLFSMALTMKIGVMSELTMVNRTCCDSRKSVVSVLNSSAMFRKVFWVMSARTKRKPALDPTIARSAQSSTFSQLVNFSNSRAKRF